MTLTTKKRLPKNWRTLPGALRSWFESPDLAPPSVTYDTAIKYASKTKQYNSNGTKSSIPKTSVWNSSPQFGGSSIGNTQSTQNSSPTSVSKINY